ncbi:hypothetical protein N0V84_005905 [Fusarium piperis]|uniref:Fungal N-terminal domain-containing protein n=1 Tax=Fusarium piperis TaxID=1435070 RepID=A0A9W8WCT0_9HYPO|nr:hypothetical protein N0V84_005905 [Fusarium piperis]
MDGISGAVGFFSLILPAVTGLSSRVCKTIGEISKTKRAAQDPKVFMQLKEELETCGQLFQSMSNIKRSDGQAIIKAKSHCEEYERALLETKECLKMFRQTEVEDWQEITKILLDLNDQRKSVKHHRKKVERWLLSINTIIVNLTHEQLARNDKHYSEAFDTQAQSLEGLRQQIQRIETLLKEKLSQDHNAMQQMESASPVAELAAITDDLLTICSQQIAESTVGRGTRVDMCDSSYEEDASEVGSKNSLEDRTQPDEDLDQYQASNAALKKLESSTAKECCQIVAGSFGQATRGGPEVLALDLKQWHEGVWEDLWFSKGYTIGIAFERDWRPFQK